MVVAESKKSLTSFETNFSTSKPSSLLSSKFTTKRESVLKAAFLVNTFNNLHSLIYFLRVYHIYVRASLFSKATSFGFKAFSTRACTFTEDISFCEALLYSNAPSFSWVTSFQGGPSHFMMQPHFHGAA